MSNEWLPNNKKGVLENSLSKEMMETKKFFEKQKASIALELIKNNISFPFPGITSVALDSIKAFHKEFPEIGPSVKEVLSKFEGNAIKLTMGSGNLNPVVIAAGSNDAIHDSIPLKDLQTNKQMHPQLKILIEMDSALTTIGNLRKRIAKNKN